MNNPTIDVGTWISIVSVYLFQLTSGPDGGRHGDAVHPAGRADRRLSGRHHGVRRRSRAHVH